MLKPLTSAALPQRSAHRGLMARWPLVAFFALAFGLTWSFLIADLELKSSEKPAHQKGQLQCVRYHIFLRILV
jgi:hypothetical protein